MLHGLNFRNVFVVNTNFYVFRMPAFLTFLYSRREFGWEHTIKQ